MKRIPHNRWDARRIARRNRMIALLMYVNSPRYMDPFPKWDEWDEFSQ